MQEAVLIYPHHLFEHHPALQKDRLICFIEDPLFFSDQQYPTLFHKQKLLFHRISMKEFAHSLEKKGYKTLYIEWSSLCSTDGNYEPLLRRLKVRSIHVAEFDDYTLEKRVRKAAAMAQLSLHIYPSPAFLTPLSAFQEVFENKSSYFFHSFYIHQRKRMHILVDKDLRPLGDQWSYDADNRKKAPKNLTFPPAYELPSSAYFKEAKEYVITHFPSHPGDIAVCRYPTTHAEAKKWLIHFLDNKLALFGVYEDAIVYKESSLFHSVLSPLLNTGLLTPEQVVKMTLEYADSHPVAMNSLEGFIRQVIGWREFIRGIYHERGSAQRTRNFFHHTNKIPSSFYTGTTGILPVDDCIQKLHKHAYCHHIERLMVLGNFFLLCEIDPDEVYRWFMEMFIDAYDWVMVPNVYGMSQYADGGMMTTKPYISGSNYLLKMSDYPKGPWTKIWDSLFWRFMIKHLSFFQKQPRMQMLCAMAQKKEKDHDLRKIGETFLSDLHSKL
ncbi:MAG: cryptochrome/photolyase family protein [Chlamydiae bacterium]|nr:cryptochrome/photolyase family protein [Chlamydiota bacterium]